MRILLVEDDLSVAKPVVRALRKIFAVDHASSYKEAALLIELHCYDLLLLDLYLPDGNGVDLINSRKSTPHVIILSGDGTEKSKVFFLQNGAADYICKPFSIAELIARVNNVARSSTKASNLDTTTGLFIDQTHKQAQCNGKLLPLRRKEFEILAFLEKHIHKPVVKSLILEAVWDERNEPFSNTIDVHICALRKALRRSSSKFEIHTIRGVGYLLTQSKVTS